MKGDISSIFTRTIVMYLTCASILTTSIIYHDQQAEKLRDKDKCGVLCGAFRIANLDVIQFLVYQLQSQRHAPNSTD